MCPLEDSMKNPQKFIEPIGVLNIGMTIAMALYSCFGFLGYLKYGDGVKDAVTDNLRTTEWEIRNLKSKYLLSNFVILILG